MKKLLVLISCLVLTFATQAQTLSFLGGYGQKATRFRALNYLGLPVNDTICDLVQNASNGTCLGAVVYKQVGPDSFNVYVKGPVKWDLIAGSNAAPALQDVSVIGDTTNHQITITGNNAVDPLKEVTGLTLGYDPISRTGDITSYDYTDFEYRPIFIKGSTLNINASDIANINSRATVNSPIDDGVSALQVNGPTAGANANLPTQYVTRQQMTDSLDGRSSAITASNGLTKVGNDIQFGGSIASATTVEIPNSSLTFNGGPISNNRTSYQQTPSVINLNRYSPTDSLNFRMQTGQMSIYARIPSATSTYVMQGGSHILTTTHTAGGGRSSSISTSSGNNSISLNILPVSGGAKSLQLDSASFRMTNRVRIGGGTDDVARMLQVNGTAKFYDRVVGVDAINIDEFPTWGQVQAAIPATPTLQQVTTAGNTTNQTVVIGNHTFGTSRVLINNAADDGANPLQVSGDGVFKSAGGTVGIQLGREVGLNAFTSGNNGFAAWQPLGLLSGGLLVSNRIGMRPPDDGESSLQVKGIISAENPAGSAAFWLKNPSGVRRWTMYGEDAEAGSNTGYNFAIARYNDAGGYVDAPIYIVRNNGNVGIGTTSPATKLEVNGTITAPSLTSPSGDNLFTYANGAPSGAVGTWTTQGLGIGGIPGGAHTERLLVAGNAVATDAWILDGGGVIGEWFLDGGSAAGVRTTSHHPLNFYSSNTLRMQLKADGVVKTWSAVAGNTRVQNTATPFSVQPTDHIILIAGSGTGAGTGVLITLPDPSATDNQGRELIFIEQTSSSWASSYTLYHGATPPRNDISGNMTLRAVAGQWYIISEVP